MGQLRFTCRVMLHARFVKETFSSLKPMHFLLARDLLLGYSLPTQANSNKLHWPLFLAVHKWSNIGIGTHCITERRIIGEAFWGTVSSPRELLNLLRTPARL